MTATTEVRTNGHPAAPTAPVASALRPLAVAEQTTDLADGLVPGAVADELSSTKNEFEGIKNEVQQLEKELLLELARAKFNGLKRTGLAQIGQEQKIREAQLAETERETLAELAAKRLAHEAQLRRDQQKLKHDEKIANQQASHQLWHARVKLLKDRLMSPASLLADFIQTANFWSNVLVVATIVFMGVSAAVTQDGLQKNDPTMGPVMYVLSYGLDLGFAIVVAAIMGISSRAAQRGRKVNWWLVIPVELVIIAFSILMTTVPRMGHVEHAWVYAGAPLIVTCLLGTHTVITLVKVAEMRQSAAEEGEDLKRAIGLVDAHTAKLIGYADAAFEAMKDPNSDLHPVDATGVPSASKLQVFLRDVLEVGGGKPVAIEVRDVMKLRVKASDQ